MGCSHNFLLLCKYTFCQGSGTRLFFREKGLVSCLLLYLFFRQTLFSKKGADLQTRLIGLFCGNMAAQATPLSKMKEQLTCAVCLDLYTDPKTLPCHHAFCHQCLEGLPLQSQQDSAAYFVSCPTCRRRTELPEPAGVAGFPVAFQLNNLKEIYSQMKKAPADVCSSHDKPLEVFCETCDHVICFQCAAQSHKDHEWNPVIDSYLSHCQKLELGLKSIREKADAIKNVFTALTEREDEIKEQGETVKEELRVMVVEMINALRQSGKQLVSELETVTDSKLQVLSQQKKLVKTNWSHLKDCEHYVEQRLKKYSPHQMLSSKKQIMEHMSQVTKQINVAELNPIEKADIQLIKNQKVVEAAKSFHHIGDIVSTTLQQCQVKMIDEVKHNLGKKIVWFLLSIELPDSSPLTVPLSSLSCSLVPVGKGKPITATVTSTTHPGVYRIHCTPLTHGRHQVNVQVHDVQLETISLVIPFNPYLHTITPVCTVGELDEPRGLAVHDDGHVIIAENSGHCVTILDREGKKVKSIGGYRYIHVKGDGNNVKFNFPRGVAITPDNFILVTDENRIQKVTAGGQFIASVGERGSRTLQFDRPAGIAVSPVSGHVYVADRGNHRIQVLTPKLTFSHSFGKYGSAEGQFDEPSDIAIDSQGLLYVADWFNHRIQKFTPKGKFLAQFGTYGSDPGQLSSPRGITVDATGLVYVTEEAEGNKRVSIFTSEGQFVHKFGEGFLSNPLGITFGNKMLYVCDSGKDRLVMY